MQSPAMELQLPQAFHFIGKSAPEGAAAYPVAVRAYADQLCDDLKARGVKPGDRVGLWLMRGVHQLAAIMACWQAGAAFCVLPSFAARAESDRSKERIAEVLDVLGPRMLIQSDASPLPISATEGLEVIILSEPDLPAVPEANAASFSLGGDAHDLAFIQFTSGSTGGKPKGAEVRFGQLEANLDALARRIDMTCDDRMVSWAPMYHDMGLMAVLLALKHGADLVLMETDHFVRRPTAWLEAISRYKGTLTTAPPTALKLLTRRKAKEVDLSTLRYGWIGGEAVFPVVLQTFEETYAKAGLQPGALQPTYGMAETVVGISCGIPGTPWRTEQDVISCGPVLDNMDVRVVAEDGTPLPDGTAGHLHVRGPSVIDGYLGLPRFEPGGWFDTGDLAFQWNGHVYVSGRFKDVLKRGAESFTAAHVETIAEEALALRTGRAAAFTHFDTDAGKEEIVLLVETRDWDQDQARVAAAAVLKELGLQIDVIRAPQGGRLPRTSSGKLMRQMTAKQYKEGAI